MTTEKGQLGILPHHTDLIAKLKISPLTVNENGHVRIYSIGGGRIQIVQKENTAYLLVDSIERAEDIDKERALRAKENAEKALEEAESQRDITARRSNSRERSIVSLSQITYTN